MLGGAGFLLVMMSKFSCLDDQFSLLNDDFPGLQHKAGVGTPHQSEGGSHRCFFGTEKTPWISMGFSGALNLIDLFLVEVFSPSTRWAPLPVISMVISPLIGVITPVTQL